LLPIPFDLQPSEHLKNFPTTGDKVRNFVEKRDETTLVNDLERRETVGARRRFVRCVENGMTGWSESCVTFSRNSRKTANAITV
jgi:hypothetical protein